MGRTASAKEAESPAGPSLDSMWAGFRKSKSAQFKNALIERYMPLVRAISGRIAADLPSSVDSEDLVSSGTFGLMDAIERYDPDLGTRFEGYCAVRVRGAILDELRHLNWVPRLQSTRATKVGAAQQALKGELGRAPTPQEVARKTGLNVRDVNNLSQKGRKQLSLTAELRDGRSEKSLRRMDIVEANRLCDPAELLQERERRDILAREVRKLPKAERLLVMLYYFDELTMRQVGEVLNVTESRVCQMHSGVLSRLQQRLRELDESHEGGR